MKVINVSGMHCDRCAKRVKEALLKLDKVDDVVVNLSKQEVIIKGDNILNKDIKSCLQDLDYEVKKIKEIKEI